ncbi:MAG: 2-C-methyl-D-erythritol 4-phosphate cytidylyltransferase [Chitinophagaceae bacterium]|jgi:2-C-methyl-D-erythritol 4-phosphate cytidylyltransferase
MKKVAVIVAGGTGQRMKNTTPKQFIQLVAQPLLVHTIRSFLTAYHDIQLVVVLPSSHEMQGRLILDEYFPDVPIQITTGGETRFHSVQNGLRFVKEESIVFVHDGVRCLVSAALIQRCYETAVTSGSAIPALVSSDSIRIRTHEGHHPHDRNEIFLIQTPQTFQSSWILPAFEQDYDPSFTDEATVVETTGRSLTLVEGEESNIKITRPVDLLIAAQWLSLRGTSNGQ